MLLITAAIVAGLALCILRRPTERGPSAARARHAAAAVPGIARAVPATSPEIPPAPPADAPSELARDLDRPNGDIHADLRTLDEIFRQYRSSTHRLNPVGENAEITAALTGRNNLGFAFIPPDHPAINARGELCDRWGTPFFFHSLSGTQMELRSAGPDRKLWTADDEVLTPGLRQPQL